MNEFLYKITIFLNRISFLVSIYMIIYCTILILSIIVGSIKAYQSYKVRRLRNSLKLNNEYIPISIIAPAYNEEVTIIDSINNMLKIDYKMFEIIVVDDGSTDKTAEIMINHFHMHKIEMPIKYLVPCKKAKEVYKTNINGIDLLLVRKENGKKADASNLGINVSKYPYIIDTDVDSIIQADCLQKIIIPVLMDQNTVACGGRIGISNGLNFKDGYVVEHKLPKKFLVAMQVLEYDRSFLSSRVFFDTFNGNLIISGALGLFKKDMVFKVNGYRTDALGEDMDLATRIHMYCKKNKIKYKMAYVPDAICWTQAPSTWKDIKKQRQRWFIGLQQVMIRYKELLFKNFSYIYYFLFEFLSPFIETFGLITMLLSIIFKIVNAKFIILLFALCVLFATLTTLASYETRVYLHKTQVTLKDDIKALILCFFETLVWKPIHTWFRVTTVFLPKSKKYAWQALKREKMNVK